MGGPREVGENREVERSITNVELPFGQFANDEPAIIGCVLPCMQRVRIEKVDRSRTEFQEAFAKTARRSIDDDDAPPGN